MALEVAHAVIAHGESDAVRDPVVSGHDAREVLSMHRIDAREPPALLLGETGERWNAMTWRAARPG
jgi:hypothetical protein